jgi:Ran GTPase-activating protein (RanGAP) involved in mRNA processing and transport
LSEQAIQILTQVIMESQYLKYVDLSWCKTVKRTWTHFFDKVKNNTKLRSLGLASNGLFENDSQTLQNLVTFIKKNISLQHLDLTATGLTK